MAGMILFDGVSLESVAPVLVEDVHVSPIQLSAVARQRPIRFGANFVRMTGGARSVAITFGLPVDDMTVRAARLQSVTDWATSFEPKRLQLPGHDGVYLEAICTALPDPSTRQWWESRLRLVFTCFDNPYWTSIQERSAACGTPIVVVGNAEPLMQIRRVLGTSAASQTYSNGTESMTFSSIPAGNMVIDLNRQTADVDGQSIMGAYPLTGATFLRPRTGAQTITGTGTVYWRERWQ